MMESLLSTKLLLKLSPGSTPAPLEPAVDIPSVEEDEARRGAEEG